MRKPLGGGIIPGINASSKEEEAIRSAFEPWADHFRRALSQSGLTLLLESYESLIRSLETGRCDHSADLRWRYATFRWHPGRGAGRRLRFSGRAAAHRRAVGRRSEYVVDDRNAYLGDPDYGVIVGFLRGARPDWEGRWLSEIRDWDDLQLEQDHQYIQWMFPLTTESEAIFAPRLRDFEVTELRQDARLQQQLISSLDRMLRFLGFDLVEPNGQLRILPSGNFQQRCKVWMSPGNHNYHRISRILGSLSLAGLQRYAEALLEALEGAYNTEEGRNAIDQISIWYWREYARKRGR